MSTPDPKANPVTEAEKHVLEIMANHLVSSGHRVIAHVTEGHQPGILISHPDEDQPGVFIVSVKKVSAALVEKAEKAQQQGA